MSTRIVNPFYALLMVAGTVFVLTAIPYWFMCLREANATPAWLQPEAKQVATDTSADPAAKAPLFDWLRVHGLTALLVELGVLGLATFAAIGTDDYWERRAAAAASPPPARPPISKPES